MNFTLSGIEWSVNAHGEESNKNGCIWFIQDYRFLNMFSEAILGIEGFYCMFTQKYFGWENFLTC